MAKENDITSPVVREARDPRFSPRVGDICRYIEDPPDKSSGQKIIEISVGVVTYVLLNRPRITHQCSVAEWVKWGKFAEVIHHAG